MLIQSGISFQLVTALPGFPTTCLPNLHHMLFKHTKILYLQNTSQLAVATKQIRQVQHIFVRIAMYGLREQF